MTSLQAEPPPSRHGWTRLCTLSVLPAALLLVTGCGRHEERRTAGVVTPPARSVQTVRVNRVAGAETWAPGTLQARQRAALSARIPASVVLLPYREGDRVEAGVVVVRLDDAAVRAALAAAEAALLAAETDLRRVEALVARDAATPRERDEAAARAAAARSAREAARDQLAYAALRAPFSGRVARKPVNLGDVVSPGATLIELEGEARYELVASIASDLAARLSPGIEARAVVDGLGQPLWAKVTAVSPAGDPTTHRFEVRADLPPTAGLRSGLFARLQLSSPSENPRLVLPKAALFRRGGLDGVFVVSEGRAMLRWVAVGGARDELVEIRAGLEAGERVALDPARLANGVPVSEESPAASEATGDPQRQPTSSAARTPERAPRARQSR